VTNVYTVHQKLHNFFLFSFLAIIKQFSNCNWPKETPTAWPLIVFILLIAKQGILQLYYWTLLQNTNDGSLHVHVYMMCTKRYSILHKSCDQPSKLYISILYHVQVTHLKYFVDVLFTAQHRIWHMLCHSLSMVSSYINNLPTCTLHMAIYRVMPSFYTYNILITLYIQLLVVHI